MKKNFKILTLALAAALIIGTAIGISASAEVTAPEIISQNVEYGGNYALLYAVKADTVVGNSVSIAVYDNANCTGKAVFTDAIEAKAENTESVHGIPCYVFTTNGIAAKDMDVQYYVKVTADNGETVKRYSVAEYLYERLYKNGVAYSTDAGDVKRAELYNTILLYGKQAQDVLFNLNDKTEDDRTTFVTDMKYVYVEDAVATFDGKYSSAILSKGSALTLISSESSIPAFDLFDLTTGKKIGTVAPGTEVKINEHTKVVAYNPYAASKYADIAENYNGKSYSDLSSFITEFGPSSWTKSEKIENDALVIKSTDAGEYNYSFNHINAVSTDYVFETDLRLVNFSTGRGINFTLGSNPSASATMYGRGLMITTGTGDNEGYYVIKALRGTKEYNIGISTSSSTNDSGWLNVRYELDSSGNARLIVNGKLIDSYRENDSASGSACIQMSLLGTYGANGPVGTFYFDNTYSGSMKEEVFEFGVRGSGTYYEESQKFDNATYDSLISSGVMNAHKTYGLGGGRSLSFENNVMTWKSTKNAAEWGALNFAGSGSTIRTNAVFEADVKITGDIGDSARPTYLCASSSSGASIASVYAFNLGFANNTDTSVGGYIVTISNGGDKYAVIPENTWVNIRYEFDGLNAGDTARLIINGEVVIETTNKTTLSFSTVDILAQSNYGGEGFGIGTFNLDNVYLGAKK